jgi:hypothetical protein
VVTICTTCVNNLQLWILYSWVSYGVLALCSPLLCTSVSIEQAASIYRIEDGYSIFFRNVGVQLARDRIQWRAVLNTVDEKFGFHKRGWTSWLPQRQLSSYEGIYSMDLFLITSILRHWWHCITMWDVSMYRPVSLFLFLVTIRRLVTNLTRPKSCLFGFEINLHSAFPIKTTGKKRFRKHK